MKLDKAQIIALRSKIYNIIIKDRAFIIDEYTHSPEFQSLVLETSRKYKDVLQDIKDGTIVSFSLNLSAKETIFPYHSYGRRPITHTIYNLENLLNVLKEYFIEEYRKKTFGETPHLSPSQVEQDIILSCINSTDLDQVIQSITSTYSTS